MALTLFLKTLITKKGSEEHPYEYFVIFLRINRLGNEILGQRLMKFW